MTDIKNEFYLTLDDNTKKEYKILFIDKYNDNKNKEIDEFNNVLKKFIQLQKSKDEIDLSFVCFQDYYDFTDKSSSFNKILETLNILNYYKNNEGKICSNINKAFNFANASFYKRLEFIRVVFKEKINFEGAYFYGDINFEQSVFQDEVIFEGIHCKKEVIFVSSSFEKKASFYRAKFYEYCSFKDAIFHNEVDFENAISKDLFFFHNVKLGKISLIGSHLENANFLRLKDKDNKVLGKNNFLDKDSVRLIKSQYEKENNTTEVNWSFPLEQEFYLDLLSKEKSYYPNNSINKFSLLIHKYVSNYGTNWVRVLIILFAFGFIASLGYTFFDKPVNIDCEKYKDYLIVFNYRYWLYIGVFTSILFYILHMSKKKISNLLFFIVLMYYIQALFMYESLQQTTNYIILLINPLNIFNQDMVALDNGMIFKNINYFENIALYGVVVKVITISLLYQFVISFKNSAKRK